MVLEKESGVNEIGGERGALVFISEALNHLILRESFSSLLFSRDMVPVVFWDVK